MHSEPSSDFDKLKQAFQTLTGHVSSFDEFLNAFGLSNLPVAQRYGIVFGIIVFIFTIGSVVSLLVMGGSFQRIAQQAETGATTVPDPVRARNDRALLYERLLQARDRMIKENYEKPKTTTEKTNLMLMLLNLPIKTGNVAELADNEEKNRKEQERFVPPGYQNDYREAYRKCQDRPNGAIMSGRPEARFEAYARAWAGCGEYVTREYKRSYARLYEHFSCQTHGSEDKFRMLYSERSDDIIGRHVRLEALEADRHADEFYAATCGNVFHNNKSYDPKEVWGFLPYGPFENAAEAGKSPIFDRKLNEASFAIIDNLTDRFVGVIILTDDDPQNLSISLEPPIARPSAEGSADVIEACFLLMDKLFALGYRRIQYAVDSQDAVSKKLAARLGFTNEGETAKHKVVKDANRDSTVYATVNSDWTKGCRRFLFKKLHGARLQTYDSTNEKKEAELDEQTVKLAEKKAEEAAKKAKKV